jgi:hypothetical protein
MLKTKVASKCVKILLQGGIKDIVGISRFLDDQNIDCSI